MKSKKISRFLCLLVSTAVVFTMLPSMSVTAYAATAEQFSLPIGDTYYFDLSGETNNIGTINTAVPDITLHYVPFTYVGTVKSYSLDSSVSGNIGASAAATPSDRSLFVADYNIGHTISWRDLNAANLIFGRIFDTNYKLRSLSTGSSKIDNPESGAPKSNEWDSILKKSGLADPIKNWRDICSWGQDTANGTDYRALRGCYSAAFWGYGNIVDYYTTFGFRPALEVLNTGTLGSGGLKAVTLNLSGGTFNGAGSVNIVCAGDTFKAPSAVGLSRPNGSTGTHLGWNTQANGSGTSYAVGANVPKTVSTLYAQWIPTAPPTFGVSYDVVGGKGSGSRLESSLDKVVTEPGSGITAEDKAAGNNVSLKLTVTEKTAASTPDSEKIEGVRQGDNVQYYDATVEKTVTTSGGSPTITKLTCIPKAVRAIIPMPTEIQGKTSYTVYRVHNGMAEKIPNDLTAPEFYSVNKDGTSLTLHVKNFSTYAVIAGNKALSDTGTLGDAAKPANSAVDVQGKVLEGVFGIYKLDASWGAMKFDYNASGAVWDPNTHSYIPGSGTKGWTKESFEAGNNKITVANHSNGDVTLSYLAKVDAVLAGSAMTVRSTNSLQGVEAVNLLLTKVPTETAAAPTVDTYVWLTGEPTNLAGLNDKTYTKAGVITITAEADTTSGLTPKKSTP